MTTVVATANVLGSLPRATALAAVSTVLEREPDLVLLQEWYPRRRGLLARLDEWAWFQPVAGGCAVGARRDRFDVLSRRSRPLSRPGLSDRGGGLRVEPGRVATDARFRDRTTGAVVAVVDYHLVSQVQARGVLREHDRPRLVARHRREAQVVQRLVARARATAEATYAGGDANLHGFALPGLVSVWAGRPGAPGTLGPHRRVDDVFAESGPLEVELVETASDHRAVVATYA